MFSSNALLSLILISLIAVDASSLSPSTGKVTASMATRFRQSTLSGGTALVPTLSETLTIWGNAAVSQTQHGSAPFKLELGLPQLIVCGSFADHGLNNYRHAYN